MKGEWLVGVAYVVMVPILDWVFQRVAPRFGRIWLKTQPLTCPRCGFSIPAGEPRATSVLRCEGCNSILAMSTDHSWGRKVFLRISGALLIIAFMTSYRYGSEIFLFLLIFFLFDLNSLLRLLFPEKLAAVEIAPKSIFQAGPGTSVF